MINKNNKKMYSKERPIIVVSSLLPGEGCQDIHSNASTIDELRRDICAQTNISMNDLAKLQIQDQDGNALTSVPLFEACANVNSELDPNFDHLVNNFKNNAGGSEYLCVMLSQPAKNFASGSKLDLAIEGLKQRNLVDDFIAEFKIVPQLASCRQVTEFINRQQYKNSIQKNAEKKADVATQIGEMRKAIEDMASTVAQSVTLSQQAATKAASDASEIRKMIANRYNGNNGCNNGFPEVELKSSLSSSARAAMAQRVREMND